MIKLIKSTFYEEDKIKRKLADFVLGAEKLSMGEHSKQFEDMFGKKQGRKYSIFVNSGSSANLLLFQALINIGLLSKEDRVGISALTWPTNVMPIMQLGLVPIPIDCERETLNVSPAALESHLSDIKALFITNVLGLCDDIARIKQMCDESNILLFEDNCESLGSTVGGTLLGNFGLASTFSFYVGHHLSTIEGGMIATDDEELSDAILMARAHGWGRNLTKKKNDELLAKHAIDDFYSHFTFYDLAYNFRPSELHSFIGTIQLQYWDIIVKKREENFRRLHTTLEMSPDLYDFRVDHMDTVSNFAIPVIVKSDRNVEGYKDRFRKAGVEIRPIVAGNIEKQPFFRKYYGNKETSPNASFIHKNGFYFGNNPELTDEEMSLLNSLLVSK